MEDRVPNPAAERSIYLTITACLQVVLAAGLVWYALRRDWQNVFLTAAVIGLTLLPIFTRRQFVTRNPSWFLRKQPMALHKDKHR